MIHSKQATLQLIAPMPTHSCMVRCAFQAKGFESLAERPARRCVGTDTDQGVLFHDWGWSYAGVWPPKEILHFAGSGLETLLRSCWQGSWKSIPLHLQSGLHTLCLLPTSQYQIWVQAWTRSVAEDDSHLCCEWTCFPWLCRSSNHTKTQRILDCIHFGEGSVSCNNNAGNIPRYCCIYMIGGVTGEL